MSRTPCAIKQWACDKGMRRWTLILAVATFAVRVGFAQPVLPASPTNDFRDPVRVRLVHLRPVPFTNSLFLDAHRAAQQVTFSSLTRRETRFGGAIAAAGDVNGDGFGDVVVSAAHHQSGRLIRAGAVTLLAGSSTGLLANAGWSVVGGQASRQLGRAIAGGQDVNGDSLPDIAVATVHRMSAGVSRGGLNLFLGSTNPISEAPNWHYLPEARDGQLGESLAMEDVNGDGFADLIAGASRHTEFLEKEGAAFLFLGSRSGLPDAPSWSAFGGATNSEFGDFITAPGDVNGDGFPDVLVGAPVYPVNGQSTGRVFLFMGGTNGLSPTPAWTTDGIAVNSQFGQAISGVGDVNGDGCSDFIVGAPQRSSTDPLPGAVSLFLGSKENMSTNPVWSVSGEAPGARFGTAVAGLGDVNGDGLNDVLIGSPELTVPDGNGRLGGRAYLYLGVKDGIETKPSWIVEGANAFRAGTDLAALGDLNKDGFADFAIGLPQRARVDVFYGAATGYNRGDTFPADDISAMNVRPAVVAPELGTNFALNPFAIENPPPPPTSRTTILLALALLPVVLGGMFAIMLKRQRAAVEAERTRIAKDLHDEMGSRLTQISLLGDRIQAGRLGATDAGDESAGDLAAEARQLAGRMDEVVWTIAPDKSSLEELVTFLGQSGERYFAGSAIRYRQFLPVRLPDVMLSLAVRKHLPMVVKEAFNNAAKHSGASEVHLRVSCAGGKLNVSVADNGTGRANGVQKPAGNGLQNMRSRVEEIGGTLAFLDRPEGGVTVGIDLPL